MAERSKSIVWGSLFIAVGILALLNTLGLEWLRMERLWPGVLMALGLFSLIAGLRRTPRSPDGVWLGLCSLLGGAFFLRITLGSGEWGDLAGLWPVFPGIAGVAWIVAWAVDMQRVPNLVLGIIALVVAAAAYAIVRGLVAVERARTLASLWPLILIALGVSLIIQHAVRRR